jgi:undecaprenyl-diphosphatase
MDTFQIIVLALVQGLTEFLPISSSAHLILVPKFFGWQDQGLAIDVAAHFGTLLAILWYFRHDLHPLFMDWSRSIQIRKTTGDSVLAWGVIIGTLPAGLAGYLLDDYSEYLRNPLIIASTTLIFGFLLWYADASSQKNYVRCRHLIVVLNKNLNIS